MHTAVRLRLNELKSSLSHMVSVGSQQRFLFSLQNKNQTSVWHSQKRYVKNSRYGKSSGKPTRLSPKQATLILQSNEKIHEVDKQESVLKSIDWNQLGSNNPLEDTLAIAELYDSGSYLLGVFDGHGGAACAQVLAKRLLSYIAASLPSQYVSSHLLEQMTPVSRFHPEIELLYDYQFNQYHTSVSYLRDVLYNEGGDSIEQAMVTAFEVMDQQLGEEALAFLLGQKMDEVLHLVPRWDWKPWWKEANPIRDKILRMSTLGVAMSGAVASIAYISANNLVLANTGDCQAVLGSINEDGTWAARKLGMEHTTENLVEVERVYSEHPASEQDTVIRMDRLLGQLMPLRAFGDFRFKWSRQVLDDWVNPVLGESVTSPHYKTPPYLTARPEIIKHTLAPKDKFLVIASDGLWDLLSPTQVVRLVGEHMSGRVALGPLTLPTGDVTLNVINQMLHQRREELSKCPLDSNAATHLIRHALGSTETGLDHQRLSQVLTLPGDVVRLFRDDISIIVAYFDTDYLLKSLPAL